MMLRAVASIAAFWVTAILRAEASIHEYNHELFRPRSNSFFFHGGSEGLYREEPGSGSSFIRFESVTFRRTKESTSKQNEMQQKTGLVEAIIVEVKDKGKIGGSHLGQEEICCTPALAKDGSCKVGEVIIVRSDSDWPRRVQTYFEGRSEEARMAQETVGINRTGMYYLYFMFCDPELEGISVSGKTVWRNPDGYLPGRMSPLMTLYGFMSLAYLSLGLLWFSWFVKYWKEMVHPHHHITSVIALGMCETAIRYFEYANFNSTGSRPTAVTAWAVTVGTGKKVVSRVLLLAISMGRKPGGGGSTAKMSLLGLMYFTASESLEAVEHLGNVNDYSGKTKLVLVLLVAFLDTCFILWIFSSLSRTLEKLQMRRSFVKLELYRKLTNVLAAYVLVSVAWIGYELYFNATDPLGERWRRAWIIPAFWTLLSFLLLLTISVLWAPFHSPARYAYVEDVYDDIDDTISLPMERKTVVPDHHHTADLLEEGKRE